MDGGRLRRLTLLGAALAVALAAGAEAHQGQARLGGPTFDTSGVALVARVNVSTSGVQSDSSTTGAVLSSNGRYVAFSSRATTLTPGDTNGFPDVFVHDLRTGRTTRVSVSSDGLEADGPTLMPTISGDGRFVVFPSKATNLVPEDVNGIQDVFVRDRLRDGTHRLSVGRGGEPDGRSLAPYVSGNGKVVVFSSDASNLVRGDRNGKMDVFVAPTAGGAPRRVTVGIGGESDGRSEASAISADGRVVVFRSYASNLVPGDVNRRADVFAENLRTGRVELENVSSEGVQANGATFRGMLSANGRYVGFRSRASNLVPGDTNDALDVFVRDRRARRTTRLSVSSDGRQVDARRLDRRMRDSLLVSRPFLSANGRFAAFTSRAANLVPGDRNEVPDVFVHDLETGVTMRVSVGLRGREANGASFVSGISADGRVVAFTSFASNLVPGDTNGRKDVFVAYLWPASHGGLGEVASPLDAWASLAGFALLR